MSIIAAWTMSVIMSGCMMTGETTPATPFSVTMKSANLFTVKGREVDGANLVAALKRANVSQAEPLVIDLPLNTSFETVKYLTQKLASAGYKPFFKNPRHADTSTGRLKKSGRSADRVPGP